MLFLKLSLMYMMIPVFLSILPFVQHDSVEIWRWCEEFYGFSQVCCKRSSLLLCQLYFMYLLFHQFVAKSLVYFLTDKNFCGIVIVLGLGPYHLVLHGSLTLYLIFCCDIAVVFFKCILTLYLVFHCDLFLYSANWVPKC